MMKWLNVAELFINLLGSGVIAAGLRKSRLTSWYAARPPWLPGGNPPWLPGGKLMVMRPGGATMRVTMLPNASR